MNFDLKLDTGRIKTVHINMVKRRCWKILKQYLSAKVGGLVYSCCYGSSNTVTVVVVVVGVVVVIDSDLLLATATVIATTIRKVRLINILHFVQYLVEVMPLILWCVVFCLQFDKITEST